MMKKKVDIFNLRNVDQYVFVLDVTNKIEHEYENFRYIVLEYLKQDDEENDFPSLKKRKTDDESNTEVCYSIILS